MIETEQWKPIAGFEGLYEVSNLGRVRSLGREVMRRNGRRLTIAGRIMQPGTSGRGYQSVVLSKRGSSTFRTIHRLVALAFIPNPNGHSHVDHRDCDIANSSAANLRWVTCSMNGYNRPLPPSGIPPGVVFIPGKANRPWRLRLGGKSIGSFASLESAAAARAQFVATIFAK